MEIGIINFVFTDIEGRKVLGLENIISKDLLKRIHRLFLNKLRNLEEVQSFINKQGKGSFKRNFKFHDDLYVYELHLSPYLNYHNRISIKVR